MADTREVRTQQELSAMGTTMCDGGHRDRELSKDTLKQYYYRYCRNKRKLSVEPGQSGVYISVPSDGPMLCCFIFSVHRSCPDSPVARTDAPT